MARRLRLGILSDEFFEPSLGRLGGFGWATRQVARLFHEDPALGVDVVLLTNELTCAGSLREVEVHGCRLLLRDPNRWRQLRRLRAEGLDLVLTIDYHLGYRFFLRALPFTPFLVWARDPRTRADRDRIETLRVPGDTARPRGIESLDGRSLAAVRRWPRPRRGRVLLAATSPYLIPKLAESFGVPSRLATLLPNIIEAPPAPIAKSPRPRVLFLGRLDPYKRPWLYVALAERFPDVEFLLAGQAHFEGPGGWQTGRLPANVRPLGHVDGPAKCSALASSWLLVNTSIHEGLAVSFLEALAAATPIVSGEDPEGLASRFGACVGRWPGSGQDGLAEWEAAVARLLADAPGRRRLGAAGREWVLATHNRSRFLEAFFDLAGRAGVGSA